MTEPKTAYVTATEVTKAWNNWLEFHHQLNCDEVETRFFKYCHTLEQSFEDGTLDWDSGEDTYHVAASTADHVKHAASPYSAAIFKAYYAKHGYEGRK